ncbi:hypothetical protein O181_089281 [Austropuccinia psidii MF-1]|uniref:Uncharacterized protein n=1 Tax=Austropuccinia psidii MF-1 TaxID=1389203 RepID=A0A9Q3IT68_9BASI|nr:hypothetical protein [Austropuccinia psidii MF-1]
MKGHEVDITLNIDRPYPPVLRRSAYPASPRARGPLGKNIQELIELGVLRKVGHNEEVEVTTCYNHGNSPPWISIWHIKPQSFYGQFPISITSGQYGHIIILWKIYGHFSFGAFMALHLNPGAIAAIYAQLGISGHFPQNQEKWPKWLFLAIWAHNAHLRFFAHFVHFCAFAHFLRTFAHLQTFVHLGNFCAFCAILNTLMQSVQKTLSRPLGQLLAQSPKVAKNPKGPRNTFPSSEAIPSIFFPSVFPSQDLWT